jgi:ATP phosphoribosyltransferase
MQHKELNQILKIESILIEFSKTCGTEKAQSSRLVAEKILDIIKNKKSVKKPWQHFATKYITIEELMKNAKPCTLIKDVHEEIVKEMNSPERQAKDAKRMADIAGIMNKVVGAE